MENLQERFWQIIQICLEQYSNDILSELEDLLISQDRIIKMEEILETKPNKETIIKKIKELKAT